MCRLNLWPKQTNKPSSSQSAFWLNEGFALTFGPLMVTFDLGCSKGFEVPLHRHSTLGEVLPHF